MNPNRAITYFAWPARLGTHSFLTARSPGVKLNYLHCISIRFLREININQARFSIGDGIYDAKSKSKLISLTYARAKVTEFKRYIKGPFWKKFMNLLLIMNPNRAITCFAWSALKNWFSSATWRSPISKLVFFFDAKRVLAPTAFWQLAARG